MSKKSLEISIKTKQAAGKVHCSLDLQTFLPYRMYCLAAQMSQAGNDLPELLNEIGVKIGEREWRVISILGAYGGLTNGHVANALKTLCKHVSCSNRTKTIKDPRKS